MAVLQEYKCPCCGGAIEFNSTTQTMKCPYCETEFEPEAMKRYDEELKQMSADEMTWENSAGAEWSENETDELRSYICNSCGGTIICDENTAATTCPYCGNRVIMTEQLSGALRPDYVIPFKLDKAYAKEAFNKYISDKKLLPEVFKDRNHIEEIQGVYVPFWLFDTDVDAHLRFKATRVRHWVHGDYSYTETSFYAVSRGGSVRFERVPVDGSSRMPDDLMESIEPFDYSQAVDFRTAYLAGYLADKYDVDDKSSKERANSRIKHSAEDMFRSTVSGYASVVPESSSVKFRNSKVKYALLPVWMLTTKWEDKYYTFAMNGQTCKFAGNLPVDKKAQRKKTLLYTGVLSAAVYAAISIVNILMYFFGG